MDGMRGNALTDVILLLLDKAGKAGLTKTKIIKLVFLVDLEAAKRTREQLTDCSYQTLTYGVVDLAIWDRLCALGAKLSSINIYYENTAYGNRSTRAVLAPEFSSWGDIPSFTKEVVDEVWERYGSYSASRLGGVTHELVPMFDEWEEHVPVDVRDIAYESSDEFKEIVRKAKADSGRVHSDYIPIEEYLSASVNEH